MHPKNGLSERRHYSNCTSTGFAATIGESAEFDREI